MNAKHYCWTHFIGMLTVALMAMDLAGCGDCCKKHEKIYTDTARPEWSYDQPYYVNPAGAEKPMNLKKLNTVVKEVYTQEHLLQIPRPKVGDSRKSPRMAVWLTKDNGMHWERIGYFGLQQPYFPYEVNEDGDYGIRFIGPGIPPAKCKPPKPHMIYHVDTILPIVTVFIEPDQECYVPGQTITVDWCAYDPNLKPDSIEVDICIGHEMEKMKWKKLKSNYPCTGSLDFIVPDEAIDKVITIRVSAWDKAKNMGQGYSCPLKVVYEPQATQPCSQSCTQPGTQPAEIVETKNGPQVLTTMPKTYPSMEK